MSVQAAAWDQGVAVEPAMSPKEHGRLMARLIPLFRVRRSSHVLLQTPVGLCRGVMMPRLMLYQFAEPTSSATAAIIISEGGMHTVTTGEQIQPSTVL